MTSLQSQSHRNKQKNYSAAIHWGVNFPPTQDAIFTESNPPPPNKNSENDCVAILFSFVVGGGGGVKNPSNTRRRFYKSKS